MNHGSFKDSSLLFRTLESFHALEDFSLRIRSTNAASMSDDPHLRWPPILRRLSLSGRVDYNHSLFNFRFPWQLTHLTIGKCYNLEKLVLFRWLKATGQFLQYFRILELASDSHVHPVRPYARDAFDTKGIIKLLPKVRYIRISHHYLTDDFFNGLEREKRSICHKEQAVYPLEVFEIDCQSICGKYFEMHPPYDIWFVYQAVRRNLIHLKVFRIYDYLSLKRDMFGS